MASKANITVRVTLENKRAVRALSYAAQHLAEKCEDWNPEDQKAMRAMQYALKHLQPRACDACMDRMGERH